MPAHRDDQKDRDERFGNAAPHFSMATREAAKNQLPNHLNHYRLFPFSMQ
jgi:hypothetical protein